MNCCAANNNLSSVLINTSSLQANWIQEHGQVIYRYSLRNQTLTLLIRFASFWAKCVDSDKPKIKLALNKSLFSSWSSPIADNLGQTAAILECDYGNLCSFIVREKRMIKDMILANSQIIVIIICGAIRIWKVFDCLIGRVNLWMVLIILWSDHSLANVTMVRYLPQQITHT